MIFYKFYDKINLIKNSIKMWEEKIKIRLLIQKMKTMSSVKFYFCTRYGG